MPSAKQRFGGLAEHAAEDFLRARGFEIIDRHVTSRYGEIDILCRDGQTVVAVEVRVRRGDRYGTATESITDKKVGRLIAALQDICERNRYADDIRIDLVALDQQNVGRFSVNYYAGISV